MWFPSKDALDRTKGSLEIITYLIVFFVIGFLFFNSGAVLKSVAGAFRSAGMKLEEVNLFGTVKFKAIETVDALTTAQSTTDDLKSARQLVACQSKANCSDAQKAAVTKLVGELAELDKKTTAAQQQIKQAIASSEQIVQQVEQQAPVLSPPQTTLGSWVAVAGADSTLAGAQDEIRKIKPQFSTAEIVFRRSYYLTVIRFASEKEARDAIPKIESSVGRDRQPYVRSFADWCPRARKESDFTTCNASPG